LPPQNVGGQKAFKSRRNLGKLLRLSANVFETDEKKKKKISTSCKRL